MPDPQLIALARSCSRLRTDIGRMLMAKDDSSDRVDADERLHESLRDLLRLARDQDFGLFLEIAGG